MLLLDKNYHRDYQFNHIFLALLNWICSFVLGSYWNNIQARNQKIFSGGEVLRN